MKKFFALYLLLSFYLSSLALAESPSAVLRWSADAESGAPYVFYDSKDTTRMIGFEYEIIQAIAQELHRKPVFVQTAWEGLIPGLSRGEYDVAINGIEITEDRKQEALFSEPYYETYLQIVTTQNSPLPQNITLESMRGTRVGTLSGALSERVLNEHKNIQTHLYPHEHLAHEDLLNGRIDALLFDAPIVSYYSTPNPKFKVIGKPISKMQYGIVLSKKNPELLSEINQALKKLIESGKLRNILERWNLWNSSSMPQLTGDLSASRTRPVMYEDYLSSLGIKRTWSDQIKLYQSFIPGLLKGAWMTLVISVLSMIVAMSFGLLIAVNRLYSPRPLSTLSTLYIELIRGTPLLLQLFFIFYGLPHLGIKLSPLVAAVLALGFNYAANEAENYRAGIEGVAKTQKEAAWSLGLNTFQSLRHVIIPQGIRLVIPPVTTDFISLIKDSSLVSMITLVELTKAYGQLSSTYYDFIGPALMAAALYLLMGLPFVRLARYLEQRWQY